MATKLATTTSSSDRVKASSQPATSAGAMIGSVMRPNTVRRLAPRSIAASSSDRSISCRREDTTTVTKHRVKVTWAIQMVARPRAGKPGMAPIEASSAINEKPRITSGITSGAVTSAPNTCLPRKRRKRVITIAASVPSTVAVQAVQNATTRLVHIASISARSANRSL